MRSLIVLSHRRWGFVRQRPQHLMSRLAGWYDVKFIEEPVCSEGNARLQVRHVAPGVTVMVPHTPVPEPGFNERQLPYLKSLLSGSVSREHRLTRSLAWLYTPMALPLAEALQPSLLIYDCMEDLARLPGAPPPLPALEDALLRRADLVFTAGPLLHEQRRHRHPHVHCLPSAVDAAHFSPAGLDPQDLQADQAEALQSALPRPRLGFFGVIDERLDLDLLAGLAEARPQWQIVMVGPVMHIDPATLPQRPNIHWLGPQPYARLPYLLAGWDVALMPFALNEATASMSPTKTLEYLAGEKPVVSTPVGDVALLYGHVVRVASGVLDFVAACEDTLAETRRQRSQRVMEMLTTVSTSSWDRSAATVHALIEQARAEKDAAHDHAADDDVPAAVAAALHAPQRAAARPSRPPR